MTQESKPDVRGGVVDAAKREIETLLQKHLDDVSALIAAFVASQAQIAERSPAPGGPCHVRHVQVDHSAGLWWPRGDEDGNYALEAFLKEHDGAELRITYEVVRPANHDTERPPPPPPPGIGEALDELDIEASAHALGRMVGPGRGEGAMP
jgi:hypothetical protein